MKARILVAVVVVAALSVAFLDGPQVQAQIPSGSRSSLPVQGLFAALNAERWGKEGRQFVVLRQEVTNVTTGLDIVASEVEISDHGVAWARETVTAVVYDGLIQAGVYDGLIQKLYVNEFRLTPWQYW